MEKKMKKLKRIKSDLRNGVLGSLSFYQPDRSLPGKPNIPAVAPSLITN
jgi:hypothetical protein